jgi:hypothetical protein
VFFFQILYSSLMSRSSTSSGYSSSPFPIVPAIHTPRSLQVPALGELHLQLPLRFKGTWSNDSI